MIPVICKSSLEELLQVNAYDIFENNSKVAVKPKAICFVVDDYNTYLYMAKKSKQQEDIPNIINTDILDVKWILSAKFDRNKISSLPKGRLVISEEAIDCELYKRLAYTSPTLKQMWDNAAPTALQYPIVAYNNFIFYALHPTNRTFWRINTYTKQTGTNPQCNITLNAACGCAGSDNFLYVFNTASNTATRYNFINGTWQTRTSPIPGPARTEAVAVNVSGTIYLIGGKIAGVPTNLVYAYNTSLDTYTVKNAAPINISQAGAATKQNNVYVMQTTIANEIQCVIYNTILDEWDVSSIENYPINTRSDNNVYYDSKRDKVCLLVQGDNYKTLSLDVASNEWEIDVEYPWISTNASYMSSMYDNINDRVLHSSYLWPRAAYIARRGKEYVIKQS